MQIVMIHKLKLDSVGADISHLCLWTQPMNWTYSPNFMCNSTIQPFAYQFPQSHTLQHHTRRRNVDAHPAFQLAIHNILILSPLPLLAVEVFKHSGQSPTPNVHPTWRHTMPRERERGDWKTGVADLCASECKLTSLSFGTRTARAWRVWVRWGFAVVNFSTLFWAASTHNSRHVCNSFGQDGKSPQKAIVELKIWLVFKQFNVW